MIMNAVVESVLPGTPASGTTISRGDTLRRINSHVIRDVLDYKYHSYDADILLELTGDDGRIKLVRLRKPEGADIGLVFETFLMDKERSCANKCIFCFIDQLPEGMRKTLYYKDDDIRLSLFQGNYVTLTNLPPRDIERIIKLGISPINVSVHTLDPELRAYMLGTKDGAAGVESLKRLAGAGIKLNCQIVCCPGINDGAQLSRTMKGLYALGPCVNSVSIVPVGLTKHRDSLEPLCPFDRELALKTIGQVERIGVKCLKSRGSRVFFGADELYITAERTLPPHRYYEQYPQLENGVGMMRLFITEFLSACNDETRLGGPRRGIGASESFSVVTGIAASKYLTKLLKIATRKYDKIRGKVYAIRNDFFGESVTVSGLVTGGDIVKQLKGNELGSRLLIPINMLRHGEETFLDDMTVSDVSKALGVPVRVVRQDGADLLCAFIGK